MVRRIAAQRAPKTADFAPTNAGMENVHQMRTASCALWIAEIVGRSAGMVFVVPMKTVSRAKKIVALAVLAMGVRPPRDPGVADVYAKDVSVS